MEGINALYCHLIESTYQFRDPKRDDQTIEKYLNLLKSQWLLEVIQRGVPFQQARPWSLYRYTIAQLERGIYVQYQRPDLVRFSKEELMNVNSIAFLIWPPPISVKQIEAVTDPNEGEKLILRLSLSDLSDSGKKDLIIFRADQTTMRIAWSVMSDGLALPYYVSEKVNTQVEKFIPHYTIEGSNLAPKVEIVPGYGIVGTVFEFKNEKDALNFQRAITGYQVVSDIKDVKWLAKRAVAWPSRRRSTKLEGVGRLQIWHWKPFAPAQVETASKLSTATASEGSQNDVIVIMKPHPPVVMFYTRAGEEYTYFHLESKFQFMSIQRIFVLIHLVQSGFQIVETACDCKKHPESCRQIFIENNTRSTFDIRRLSVQEASINDWNLSIFGHHRHPSFDNKDITQRIQCRFLILDFQTVEERQEFGRSLRIALAIRDKAELELSKACERVVRS